MSKSKKHMKTLSILVFILIFLTYAPKAHAITREELVQTARRVEQREAKQRAKKEFDSRVSSEVRRLGLDNSRIPVVSAILDTFGMGVDGRIALAIAKCESGLRPEAAGDGGHSIGIFQINWVHWRRWPRETLFDLQTNLRAAKTLRDEQGHWGAWSTYKNGCYRNWM